MILYRVEITNGNTDPKENSWEARWFAKLDDARHLFESTPEYRGAYLDKVDLTRVSRETFCDILNLADSNRMNLPVENLERQEAVCG